MTNKLEAEETSKNLVVCNGKTTDYLKQDWGANDVWNRIILPRFERMNQLKNTNEFTTQTKEGHTIPCVPLKHQKGFSKKRIDHRHHAMDAIVIACTTRNHVALLSNEASLPENQQTKIILSNTLRNKEKYTRNGSVHTKYTSFIKPWDTFTQDLETALNGIVVSFKQNLRVLNRSINCTTKRNAKGNKSTNEQEHNFVVRKSLHEASTYGLVNLQLVKEVSLKIALINPNRIVESDLRKTIHRLVLEGKNEKQIATYFKENLDVWHEVNLKKIKVYYYSNETSERYFARRVTLGSNFNAKLIEKITDKGIQNILQKHLDSYGGNTEEAFSPEGIERMNKNILILNNGKPHKPIYSVRRYESAEKFAIGQTGVKAKQFVEAAKGTMLYFVIYRSIIEGLEKRLYFTIPLQTVMACQKKNYKLWKEELDLLLRKENNIEKNIELYAILSPGDLVYMPTREECTTGVITMNQNNIYKVVSFNDANCYFVPHFVAKPIIDLEEYTGKNKTPREGLIHQTDRLIKDYCIPLKTNRLGEISEV